MNYSDSADSILAQMTDCEVKVKFHHVLEAFLECKELIECDGISRHDREFAYYWLGREIKDMCDSIKKQSE